MPLSNSQKERIGKYFSFFIRYINEQNGKDDLEDRQKRSHLLMDLLAKNKIDQMTEIEFGQVISSLWASQMWGDKGVLVDKLINDNGLEKLKTELKDLIWGDRTLSDRYDSFRKKIKGFGPGTITEILAFIHPMKCGLWNDKARKGLACLDLIRTYPIVKKYKISGNEYEKINALLVEVKTELQNLGLPDLDLLGIDYFLYEVQKIGWPIPGEDTDETILGPAEISDFDHDEMIDKLRDIGVWLGFDVHTEKLIAKGAKVDAVWQTKIANLGVVTYVFEVQRRGGIDSLIVNLQKAQNNPTVQRLVVAALPSEITKIRAEIESLSEDFRKSVVFMDISELIRASELTSELGSILNKLELVRKEFDIERE